MKRFVLDAWAVLALLQKEEPAASRVKSLLEKAQRRQLRLFISVINLGEVYYSTGKALGVAEAQKALNVFRRLEVEVVPAIDERVFAAANFKIHHRISYADAFAVSTANEFSAVLVTGDPELIALQEEITLEELTRQKK